MSGLGQYINLFPCPYPPEVAVWEGIPVAQVQSFTPEGFQRGDCFSWSGQGLGMFDSGLDWSQWGWQEWLTVGFGVYVVTSMVSDVGRGATRVKRAVRRRRAA